MALALVFVASPAREQVSDPAARGLAFFVHAPSSVIAGTKMPIDIEALGFATVTSAAPLAGAAIEVAWDAESLDETAAAPPSVTATSDAKGRTHLELPVPPGDGRKMRLLVGLKHGGHARTESLEIARLEEHKVELHVSESDVVPGGAITAWTRVARTADGLPIQAQPVDVELLEGSFARWSERVTTDASGMAVLRVPIPRTDEAGWTWTLRATAVRGSGRRTISTTLTPRDETPGTPTIRAEWERASAIAGDVVPYVVHVRDASHHPIAGLEVRTWVGPKGTAAPTDEAEWKRVTTLATTDANGTVHGTGKTPTLIPRGATKELQLVVRAIVEARAIEEKASIEVGAQTATVEVMPEAPALVPGIDERALVRIVDGRGDGVVGDFVVEGDGLKETVKTNAAGEAELVWHVPEGIGAKRDVGPCAGGVAAAVRIRSVDGKKGPFDTCVSVDREAAGLVRTARPFARAGERIHLDVVSPKKARVGGSSWSVLVTSPSGAVTASGWIDAAGGDITLGAGDPGTWQITVASPQSNAKAHVLGHALVVGPSILPSLAAKVSGGRLVPGGRAEIDAELTDDHGKPLQGSVSAVLIDAEGGGNLDSLGRLDTQSLLCGAAGIESTSCAKFIVGDPALDATARASLNVHTPAIAPLLDPAGTAKYELQKSFSDVLHSLEGAILESTKTPDALGDVRRKSVRGWEWNPELMTLVTASMETPPLTPGGEPIALGDLLAVDPQVTFDVAARRVTRLKLFRVLVAVRAFRKEHALDPGEPAWKSPNALLRRLVHDGGMADTDLLDPWGGTIQFVPANGPGTPFLDVARGFSLHAPGPDGVLGSGDDVKDPFERVVRSKSPYADSMGEDRLVDAKLEMEVSDSTVDGWQALMDSLTGATLGNIGTIGHGGGGGTGQGFGSGHGRLGGSATTRGPTLALATGAAFWSPPIRTDARGHVHFSVPLESIETTYRLGLVASPDMSTPASTTLDISTSLPLSAIIDTGTSMIVGDTVDARVVFRNRTAQAVRANLDAAASGVAVLVSGLPKTIDVPANGSASAAVRLSSKTIGSGGLIVKIAAPGVREDVVQHLFEVRPAGVPIARTHAQLVSSEAELEVHPEVGQIVTGRAQLVVERGLEEPLRAALRSLNPDHLTSLSALADAVETASRIQRWSIAKDGATAPLALEATTVLGRARGRFEQYGGNDHAMFAAERARVVAFSPTDAETPADPKAPRPKKDTAPKSDAVCLPLPTELVDMAPALEAEPPRGSGDLLACWDQTVSNAVEAITTKGDVAQLARAILALADRPHRAVQTASLVERLQNAVKMNARGDVILPPEVRTREARVLVHAALLRGATLGKQKAPVDRLYGWLIVDRDAEGGYGSPLATRSAVAAMLGSPLTTSGPSKVVVVTDKGEQRFDVPASGRIVIPLASNAERVSLRAEGAPFLARFERPLLRLFTNPPSSSESPLKLTVGWPSDARAGTVGTMRVVVRSSLRKPAHFDVRVPLPPGVTLAAKVDGVRQVQGVALIRRPIEGGTERVVEIPVRFGLAGRVTIPEASATVALADYEMAIAPSQPYTIR